MTSSLLLRFPFGIPGIWRWIPYSLFLWFPPMSLCFPCIFHSFLTIGSERPRSASLRSPSRGGWNLKAVLLFKVHWQVSFSTIFHWCGHRFWYLGASIFLHFGRSRASILRSWDHVQYHIHFLLLLSPFGLRFSLILGSLWGSIFDKKSTTFSSYF